MGHQGKENDVVIIDESYLADEGTNLLSQRVLFGHRGKTEKREISEKEPSPQVFTCVNVRRCNAVALVVGIFVPFLHSKGSEKKKEKKKRNNGKPDMYDRIRSSRGALICGSPQYSLFLLKNFLFAVDCFQFFPICFQFYFKLLDREVERNRKEIARGSKINVTLCSAEPKQTKVFE